MRIVFVCAEIAPWSKTGGLGDVCGALPRALARRGHRVMTVAPRYKAYPDAWETPVRARYYLFGQWHEVGFYHCLRDGVDHVFVEHMAFERPGIYGNDRGAWSDNLFRFALLSRAAFDAALSVPVEGGTFGQDVVFHANDWHAALVPVYLKALYQNVGLFPRAGCVLGLHNLGHHGTSARSEFDGLDLAPRFWSTLDYDGNLNVLKGGIVAADKLVAVSPTYAREIQSGLGFGLDGLLHFRRSDLHGVLNGIDDTWDPTTDPHIAAHYSAGDLAGKAACKKALQAELGLQQRARTPLIGLIARLDHQKGIDLVMEVMPWLMSQDVQVVMLGSGGAKYEQFFRDSQRIWPNRARGVVGFNEKLAHRIEAGADIFLMPSRFEPCGLNQLYSMRYGTIPVVHATGGLADTVETVDPAADRGTGWAFRRFDGEGFAEAIGWALLTYRKFPEAWKAIQLRGMKRDLSWERRAAEYEDIYAAAVAR